MAVGDSWRAWNERAGTGGDSHRFVVIGNPASPRIELFQEALKALSLPPARVIAWIDLLAGRVWLPDVVREGDVLRIESPGKDFEVERALLAAGAEKEDEDDPAGLQYARLDRRAVGGLSFDKGLVVCPRQWYLGFRAALRQVGRQLAACPPHLPMNDAADIEVMFDKRACHGRLKAAGVAAPRSLGPVRGFEELRWRMWEGGWPQVFVKPSHGSSASGVVAYRVGGPGQQQAITTVEMVRDGGDLRLYNSRRIRTYRDPLEIASLIDALARHRLHVEQWIPKAGISGRVFDLRVMVIAGKGRHVLVRLSRSPLTNLHLLNGRDEPCGVRRRMGEAAWRAAMGECERAMACFPGSLHGGVDLLIASGFRTHAVLEVNAFGDLLPGTAWRGMGTYAAQISAILGSASVAAAREVPA